MLFLPTGILGDGIINQPVLWRAVETPVTSGHNDYNVIVQFKSPCEVFTAAIIHPDLLDSAKEECNEMYMEYFISEMESMCPSGSFAMTERRVKRFVVSLLLATFVIGFVVPVGLGIAAQSTASTALSRTSKLRTVMEMQEKKLETLSDKMDTIMDKLDIFNQSLSEFVNIFVAAWCMCRK